MNLRQLFMNTLAESWIVVTQSYFS